MKKGFVPIISLFMIMAALCLLPLSAHAADKKMSLQWQKGKRTVEIGKKLRLKVKIRHKKRGSKLVWSSSSKKIATVSKRGVVSGKRAGKVKISVKIQGTNVKRSCKLRVVKPVERQKSSGKKNSAANKTVVSGNKPEGLPASSPSATVAGKPTTSAEPTGNPVEPTGNPAEPTRNPAEPTGSPIEPTEQPGKPTENPITPTSSPNPPSASPTPIYVPDNTELIPYSAVMEVQGETMTVYLVHKNYEGQVHVRLNGKEFTAGGNAGDALLGLAAGGTTMTNSAGTIRVSRQTDEDGALEEYWTVEDLEQGVSYQMKAKTRNSIYPAIANCGVIYFRGDVTDAIEIY